MHVAVTSTLDAQPMSHANFGGTFSVELKMSNEGHQAPEASVAQRIVVLGISSNIGVAL